MLGRNIKLERLVRASGWKTSAGGAHYFLTIEGVDENGDRNVYYARVSDNSYDDCEMFLIHWDLVDDDFKYPYSHDNTTRCMDVQRGDKPDYFRMMSKFEEHVGLSFNEFPDAVLLDLGEALHYALFAVETRNKKVQLGHAIDIIHLRKLVHASRMDIGGVIFYNLLVEVDYAQTHLLTLNYALVKECEDKKESIKWSEIHHIRYYSDSDYYSTQFAQGA